MTELFVKVLDMSLTGAMVTCCVLLVRLMLRRAPKIWSYALWSVVLFRLLCPVAISVPAAPLELADPQVTTYGEHTTTVSYIPAEYFRQPQLQEHFAQNAVQEASVPVAPMDIGAVLWLCGIGIMVLYSAVSYFQLRRNLVGAMCLKGNVYIADHIGMPFVLGLWKPGIYLPSCVPERERIYILAHEKHHIRRGDHILKILAWIALCIHWFNPLVWAAFTLAGKDMEMSCDEAVLRQMGPGIRADYSQSLLRLASGQRIFSFAPLAFGEGDTKGRVLNMANWKKPRLWISLVCVVVIVVVLAACAVNPGAEAPKLHKVQGAVEFGHLALAVPPQYSHGDSQQGGVAFYEGDVLIGGIERYALPREIDPEDLDPHELGVTIGVPDALVENVSYFGSDSSWADMEIEYFDELEPEKLNNSHYYFLYDLNVYDVWFNNDQVSQDSQILFLSSLQIAPGETAADVTGQVYDTTEPPPVERSEEEMEREEQRLRQLLEVADMKKCRDVLEMVQGSGSWWILDEQTNKPVTGILNDSSINNYLRSGEDWLTTFQIPDGGELGIFAYMGVDGRHFNNGPDSGVNEDPEIIWSEAEETELPTPWLAAYQWDESEITVVSWSADDMGECITLRIDALYPGIPESSADYCPYPSYTVNFWFDWNGAFRYVETMRSLMELDEGEYHFLNKESIVTLEEQTVRQEIEREYIRVTQ